MALRQVDRSGAALGPVVPDPGGGPGLKPLNEPLQGHLLHHVLRRVLVRNQPPPRLVPQLLGKGERTAPLCERQRPEPATMFFRVEAKPVLDGTGDGPIVRLGPGRQTVGRKLGLPCQERQETVSPILTRSPPEKSPGRPPHCPPPPSLGRGCRPRVPLPWVPCCAQRARGQLCEHLALGLPELALPFRHLGQISEHASQR